MSTPVKTIMTKKLISIPMGTTLFEAHQLMIEKRLRHLPVTDEMDDVVGLISQRDLNAIPDSKRVPVEMMMSSPVQSVPEDLSLRKTIFKMLQNKISCLLIADKDENAVGIVTTDDLLWYLAHKLADDELSSDSPMIKASTLETIGAVATKISDLGI